MSKDENSWTQQQADVVKKIILQGATHAPTFLKYLDEDAHLFGMAGLQNSPDEFDLPLQSPAKKQKVLIVDTSKGSGVWQFDKVNTTTPVFSKQDVHYLLEFMNRDGEEYWELVYKGGDCKSFMTKEEYNCGGKRLLRLESRNVPGTAGASKALVVLTELEHFFQIVFDSKYRSVIDMAVESFEHLAFDANQELAHCITRQTVCSLVRLPILSQYHPPFPFSAREAVYSSTAFYDASGSIIVLRKTFNAAPAIGHVAMNALVVFRITNTANKTCSVTTCAFVDMSGYIPTTLFNKRIEHQASLVHPILIATIQNSTEQQIVDHEKSILATLLVNAKKQHGSTKKDG